MAGPNVPSDNEGFNPEVDDSESRDPQQIVEVLEGYRQEAEQNRRSGPNGRDDKWEENLNLYWNRFDFSNKANWQAKEVMPEVPSFVDRFAASLKEALVSAPEGFYTIHDPSDTESDITDAIKRMMDVWLSTCGRNQNGHILGFPSVFEEQAKLGALMNCCAVVSWRNDSYKGRPVVETVDPRFVWLDHTYRNLYRIRRTTMDKHEVVAMAEEKDNNGDPIYNLDQIKMLQSSLVEEDEARKEELSGHGQKIVTNRAPVTLDEYLATVVGPDGEVWARDELMVVANERFLIRGPESNPFKHGKDWLVYAPLSTTPLSVYGRSYMEDFGSIAKTFNELTNMILDAVYTSSMNAFALAPGMLSNPDQVSEGISPNKIFTLEDGVSASDFFAQLELGQMPNEAVTIWQAMKNELTEAAGINEVGLGQFAPNSRTSATEIVETQQSSNALVRSTAQTVETRFLEPTLDLVWKTGLQHVKKDDEYVKRAVGENMFNALMERRNELIKRPITFQARGISTMIQKSQMLQKLTQVLQIVGGNEMFMREFLRAVEPAKFVDTIMDLSGVDPKSLQFSEREKAIRDFAEAQDLRRQQAEEATGNEPASQQAMNMATELAGAVSAMNDSVTGQQGQANQDAQAEASGGGEGES